MTERTWTINLGPGQTATVRESEVSDIDLDEEVVYLDGERLTEERAAQIARDIARRHGLRGGRPLKAEADKNSVQKAVRLTPGQAARLAEAAVRTKRKESDILRSALDAYLEAS